MKSYQLPAKRYKLIRGFTLIEIIVVMALLAVITTVGFSSFKSSQIKSRDIRRKTDIRAITQALEAYNSDKGLYPADDVNGNILACGAGGTQVCTWGTSPMSNTTTGTTYMVKVPKDPTVYRYYYDVGAGNRSYQLYGRLENTQDLDVPKSGTTPLEYAATTCNATGPTVWCNFGISSSNTSPSSGHTPQ